MGEEPVGLGVAMFRPPLGLWMFVPKFGKGLGREMQPFDRQTGIFLGATNVVD